MSVSSQNAEATHLHMRSLLELRSHNISWVNYAPCIIHAIHLFISCSQSGSAPNGCLEVRIGGSSHGLFNGLMTLRQLLIQGGFYFWPVETVFSKITLQCLLQVNLANGACHKWKLVALTKHQLGLWQFFVSRLAPNLRMSLRG